jgi:hypothetical protein
MICLLYSSGMGKQVSVCLQGFDDANMSIKLIWLLPPQVGLVCIDRLITIVIDYNVIYLQWRDKTVFRKSKEVKTSKEGYGS